MNIKIKKITLHNFLCFEHEELVLEDMGLVLVSGVNNNKTDNALSNGSGKSSMFNGICYALTGETSQGLSTNIENIYANPDDCWVELEMTADNHHFIIRRIKTPKQDMKIFVDGIDKSGKGIRESSKLLNDYLPDLNSQLIGSIMMLGQGLPQRFTNNKPSHRKELLENLTKSDYMIQSIRDKLDIRQIELRAQIKKEEDTIIQKNTAIELYNKQLSEHNLLLEEYNSINSEGSFDDKIKDLEDQYQNKLDTIEEINGKLADMIEEEKKLLEDKAKINTDASTEEKARVEELKEEYNLVYNEKVAIETKASVLSSEVKRLKSITDVCPTCGQKIPGVVKVDTTSQESELDSLNKKVKELEKKLSDLNRSEDLIRSEVNSKYELEYKKVIEELCNLPNKQLLLKEDLNKYNLESQSIFQELTKIKNLKENYLIISNKIEDLNSEINKITKERDICQASIVDINGHLNVIQNLITLAKREFRGVLLQNVIEYINKKVKQYSQEVFGNDLLSFVLDENYIDIYYCDKPYENLSGGEKQKVDIIVQLALRELLSNQLNLKINLLCLDEIFDNLDVIGCQNILNLISKLNDIESIFIITHHKDTLEISYDTEVIVEKGDNGLSKIKVN